MHQFGKDWTEDKLHVVEQYFKMYAKALKSQSFRTIYIDAFAGSGERVDSETFTPERDPSLFEGELSEIEEGLDIKEGSVVKALSLPEPFAEYIFIEKSTIHAKGLYKLKEKFSSRNIKIIVGEANEQLRKLAAETNWRKNRAAIFVDPYGAQVEWETLVTLSRTKADIALLFPTSALTRMLTNNFAAMPDIWANKIDNLLGECDWREKSYEELNHGDLFFDNYSKVNKKISTEGLRQYVLERLQTIFHYVHPEQLEMKNSKGSVMFHLFIICANDSQAAINLVSKFAKSAIRSAKKR